MMPKSYDLEWTKVGIDEHDKLPTSWTEACCYQEYGTKVRDKLTGLIAENAFSINDKEISYILHKAQRDIINIVRKKSDA